MTLPNWLRIFSKESDPINFDANDPDLLDQVYGLPVVFEWDGCPGVYPRQQMEGVILDLKTTRRGERKLLVKAKELNLPKWVNLNEVQFPFVAAESKTAAFVKAAV